MEPFFSHFNESKMNEEEELYSKNFANSPAGKKQDAVDNGIDLSSNAFMLIHGWTVP